MGLNEIVSRGVLHKKTSTQEKLFGVAQRVRKQGPYQKIGPCDKPRSEVT